MQCVTSKEKQKSMDHRHQLNQSIAWLRLTASTFFRVGVIPLLLLIYSPPLRYSLFGTWMITALGLCLLILVLLVLRYFHHLQKVMRT